MGAWLVNVEYVSASLNDYKDVEDKGIVKKVICGKCGAKQPIYIHKETDMIEGLVFDCCKCGERNELSTW